MGTQIWNSLGYLVPRVLGWVMLFGLALWDTLRHRTLKRRGWQLNRAILVSAAVRHWSRHRWGGAHKAEVFIDMVHVKGLSTASEASPWPLLQ